MKCSASFFLILAVFVSFYSHADQTTEAPPNCFRYTYFEERGWIEKKKRTPKGLCWISECPILTSIAEAPEHKALIDAAASANADAKYRLGKILRSYDRDCGPQIQRYFGEAAELGHPDAQYEVGRLLEPRVLEQKVRSSDERDYLFWFEKAAAGGSAEAMLRLSEIYSQGLEGYLENDTQARKLAISAASKGDPAIQWTVGQRFLGRRFGTDAVEAFRWIGLSASQGYGMAQYDLSKMYQGCASGRSTDVWLRFLDWIYGEASERNRLLVEAYVWANKAASNVKEPTSILGENTSKLKTELAAQLSQDQIDHAQQLSTQAREIPSGDTLSCGDGSWFASVSVLE